MGIALAACRRIAGFAGAGAARGADHRSLPDRQFSVRPQSTRTDRCGLTAMRRDTLREKLFTRRAAILASGQALLLAAIGGRMYQLQILDSQGYTVLADENRISLRLIAPVRGKILDRFGIALAENQQNYHLVIIPEQAGDVAATLDALGALIEVSETDRHRVLREIRRKHAFVPV